MNATLVLVNGKAAPLFYAGPQQINFQVPPGTTAPATAVVRQAGVESDPQTLPLFDTAPALFSVSQSGSGQGAILHADTGELASPSRPAEVAEALAIYLTGLGEAAPASAPQATIGGVAAEVRFFGDAPGLVGLNQVNVRVPAGVASGAAVLVRLTAGGRASNEVTIAVR